MKNKLIGRLICLILAILCSIGILFIPNCKADSKEEIVTSTTTTSSSRISRTNPMPLSTADVKPSNKVEGASMTETVSTTKKNIVTKKLKSKSKNTTTTTTKPKTTTTTTKPITTTTTVPTTTSQIPVSETVVVTTTTQKWIYAKTVGAYESSCKTYESYKALTSKTSAQYKLLHGGKMNYRSDGMIVDDDGYIAAALGSYFGPIGSRWIFLVEKSDGTQYELKIIKADQKQDRHTYNGNRINGSGAKKDIIEFVVDPSKMPKYANGYVYGGNFNNCSTYNGVVKAWRCVN